MAPILRPLFLLVFLLERGGPLASGSETPEQQATRESKETIARIDDAIDDYIKKMAKGEKIDYGEADVIAEEKEVVLKRYIKGNKEANSAEGLSLGVLGVVNYVVMGISRFSSTVAGKDYKGTNYIGAAICIAAGLAASVLM
ncbi:hypothetical protein BgAZ_106930 [Babesia gibsoni]|uniref:Uncharacterized protein n=1 Tax=Babesia gibsoni TaxID=33632 RepID=A0AAD8PGH7_BABGI|nr:hypothetical protein BgAZ_106930 [Babesia gibsoni]